MTLASQARSRAGFEVEQQSWHTPDVTLRVPAPVDEANGVDLRIRAGGIKVRSRRNARRQPGQCVSNVCQYHAYSYQST